MPETLILVDFENVHKVDFSILNGAFRAIIFFGATQNPPKAATKQTTAHKFRRVEFMRIEGSGKDALDFHIAFYLGRVFETARETPCVILSKDKGYDPLLLHLNKNGLSCCRVTSLEDLLPAEIEEPELVVCQRCKKADNIELHGGRWCANCGSFAAPPDPKLLPSLQAEGCFPVQLCRYCNHGPILLWNCMQ